MNSFITTVDLGKHMPFGIITDIERISVTFSRNWFIALKFLMCLNVSSVLSKTRSCMWYTKMCNVMGKDISVIPRSDFSDPGLLYFEGKLFIGEDLHIVFFLNFCMGHLTIPYNDFQDVETL